MKGILDATRRKEEAEALTNDVVAGVERTVRVWGKAHDPRLASLSAGEHQIAVLQGLAICAGQQAGALCVANPGSDPAWLLGVLTEQMREAFEDVRTAATQPPASPREQ